MTQQEFYQNYGAVAVAAGKKYGINPAVILAIASWETAYGTSYSCKNDRNFFGIKTGTKSPHWDGVSKRAANDDGGYYRVYSSVADSFLDFGWLITSVNRYASVKGLTYDVPKFAAAFITTGYMGGTQTQRNNYRDAIISRAAAFQTMLGTTPPQTAGIGIGAIAALAGGYLLFRLKTRNNDIES